MKRLLATVLSLGMIDLGHGDDAVHGWRLVQELRATRGCEELPVVLCSADLQALKALEPELDTERRVATLRLPFEIDELLRSIGNLIGRQEAPRCS